MSETVTTIIGDIPYDKPFDRSCPVCVSPALAKIDALLAYGWTYERIRAYTAGLGFLRPAPGELNAHIAHLAAPHAEARRQLEEAAAERGASVTDGSVPVDPDALGRLALNRAYQRIQDGAEVSVRDVTAILKLARDLERDESGREAATEIERLEKALRAVLWIARRHMTPAKWREFVGDLRDSDVLRELMPPAEGEPGERAAD